MIGLVVGGFIFGLLGAPFLFYLIGTTILRVKRMSVENQKRTMVEEHNRTIETLRKQYDIDRREFHKADLKIQKIIARAKRNNE
jgi:chaperonin cofactor prefoldin